MNGETLGQRMRRIREEKGIDVRSIAGGCGVHETTFRQIETGNIKKMSFAVGLRAADALNVDPYYLAFGDDGSITQRLDMFDRRLAAVEKRIAKQK